MPIRPVARGQFPRAVDRVTTTAALDSAEQRERVCAPSGKRTSTGPLSGHGGPCQGGAQGVDRFRDRRQAKAGSVGKVRPPGRRSQASVSGTHAEHSAMRIGAAGLRRRATGVW